MSMRIAVFGAECTGKSTLARQLGEHFAEPWAPEYVRWFWDAHDGAITASDLDAIARGQIANERAAAARSRQLLFCDTELITNTLWADLLFPGQCPQWLRREADRRSRNYAVYLLCDTDLPFAVDSQRCFPEPGQRAHCRRLWRRALADRHLPFVDITGHGRQRTAAAIATIEALMQRA